VSGQRVPRVGDLLGRGLHRRLDRIDVTEQALAFGRQNESAAARFVEQKRAERVLQRANAPRDRRVIDAQTLRRAARALRARDFQEEAQVVPVEAPDIELGAWNNVWHGVFLHIDRVFF